MVQTKVARPAVKRSRPQKQIEVKGDVELSTFKLWSPPQRGDGAPATGRKAASVISYQTQQKRGANVGGPPRREEGQAAETD